MRTTAYRNRRSTGTNVTAPESFRLMVEDRLNEECGLTKIERILFEHPSASCYLIANGSHLLADDRLTTEEWKKLRMFSKDKIDIIAQRALDHSVKDAKLQTAVSLHSSDERHD